MLMGAMQVEVKGGAQPAMTLLLLLSMQERPQQARSAWISLCWTCCKARICGGSLSYCHCHCKKESEWARNLLLIGCLLHCRLMP